MNEITIGKFLLWLFGLVPAVLGAILSLAFKREPIQFENKLLQRFEPLATVFVGANIGFFVGNGIVHHLDIHDFYVSYMITFLWGLFGMAIVRLFIAQLPLIFTAVRERFLGKAE